MSDLPELHWLHGKPTATGRLKSTPEDFKVSEDLGFTLDGEGSKTEMRLRNNGFVCVCRVKRCPTLVNLR